MRIEKQIGRSVDREDKTPQSNDYLVKACSKCLAIMRSAGFGIDGIVDATKEQQLPFVRSSGPYDKRYTIVVPAKITKPFELDFFLIHEMSHICREISRHPSHDRNMLAQVSSMRQGIDSNHKARAIHEVLECIRDVYADDIGFGVLVHNLRFTKKQLSEILQSQVQEKLILGTDSEWADWSNAVILVRNARAIGEMSRQGLADENGKATRLNNSLLLQLGLPAQTHFDYFFDLMIGLEENVTEYNHRQLLDTYIDRFLQLVGDLDCPLPR